MKNKDKQTSIDENQLAFMRMKNIATSLFIIMVITYIASRYFADLSPFMDYVRAFSEAAMVGALADWFAVTALFRYPLGIPIPHTAIIPKSKDRIGIGLGGFISRNFLQPQQVESRLQNIDLAQYFAQWIGEENRAKKIAKSIVSTLPRIFGMLKDGPIAEWFEKTIKNKIKSTDIATFFADGLQILIRNKRHKPIVDLIIYHTDLALNNYEPEFRAKVSKNTYWLPKLFSIDETASNSLLKSIRETLNEAKNDNTHPLRNQIDNALEHLEHNLRNDINLRNQLYDWLQEIAEHKAIAKYVRQVWEDIKIGFIEPDKEKSDKTINAITNGLIEISTALINNDELRESLNIRLKSWAIELAAAQGEAVGFMVADTIKGWDATKVVTQIENAVGRDLQYIRINGTIIGGLVGLIIHIISQFLFVN